MNTKKVQNKIAHLKFRNGQNVIHGAREFAENTRDKVEDYYKEGLQQVKKHPLRAVTAAVVIGLLLGRLTK